MLFKNKLVIIICLSFLCFGNSGFKKEQKPKINEINFAEIKNGTYKDEYSFSGFTYIVEVEVYNNAIKDIKVLNNLDPNHPSKAEKIIPNIIDKQSLKVDGITGVTTTSKVLMKAVENALIEESGK